MAHDRRARVLIVEDEPALRELLLDDLAERGYRTVGAEDLATARRRMDSDGCEVVVSDLRLPDGDGMELVAEAASAQGRPGIVLMTAFGSIPQAVEALKAGADDFLTKPLDLDHLAIRVERVVAQRRLRDDLEALRTRSGGTGTGFHGLVGKGAEMQRLREAILRVAQSDEPLFITGESGTGKELVARAVHAESPRAERAFVAVNCAGIPETLMEAEFFGHTAHAFTGAGGARSGLFVDADGGTLFLDELGEMPPALQAKLLRVLQDGRVRRLGGDGADEREVDVRVIAATNRDIGEEVAAGGIREDLYYRLEALTLHLPPLRDRGDDRMELVAHFLAELRRDLDRPDLELSADAIEALQAWSFPGNVRELSNALKRAATFSSGNLIEARHLPERMRKRARSAPVDDGDVFGDGVEPLDVIERRYIEWAVERTGGNKARAAGLLGIGRRTLYRKLDGDA